jgi:hypothetical protein
MQLQHWTPATGLLKSAWLGKFCWVQIYIVTRIKQQFISKTLLGCVLPYTVYPFRTVALYIHTFYRRHRSWTHHILVQLLLQPLWLMAAYIKTLLCIFVSSDVCVHHLYPHTSFRVPHQYIVIFWLTGQPSQWYVIHVTYLEPYWHNITYFIYLTFVVFLTCSIINK